MWRKQKKNKLRSALFLLKKKYNYHNAPLTLSPTFERLPPFSARNNKKKTMAKWETCLQQQLINALVFMSHGCMMNTKLINTNASATKSIPIRLNSISRAQIDDCKFYESMAGGSCFDPVVSDICFRYLREAELTCFESRRVDACVTIPIPTGSMLLWFLWLCRWLTLYFGVPGRLENYESLYSVQERSNQPSRFGYLSMCLFIWTVDVFVIIHHVAMITRPKWKRYKLFTDSWINVLWHVTWGTTWSLPTSGGFFSKMNPRDVRELQTYWQINRLIIGISGRLLPLLLLLSHVTFEDIFCADF